MSHKFTIKRTEYGYITCCGTEVTKITKSQDPDMYGTVNWYYQNANEDIDCSAFYSYAEIKKYLMKEHDRKFGTMEYTELLLAQTAKTLAKYAKVGA